MMVLTLRLITGTIGFFACWMFVHRIYGSLKID
jgi:transmembrane 9 superfamily member 2/4